MTIISFRHKFVFLANKKCASTLLHHLLKPYGDLISIGSIFSRPIGKHDNALEVKYYLESQGYIWSDFKVLTTIREPIERIFSAYKYELLCKYFKEDLSLEEYYMKGRYYRHFQDLEFFTRGCSRQQLLIIKSEELDKSIDLIMNHIGLSKNIISKTSLESILPKINSTKTNSKLESQYLKIKNNQNLIQLINSRHKSDSQYYTMPRSICL